MDKKLVGLITVFLLVFGVFMGYLVYTSSSGLSIRAANQNPISCPNSFLFASSPRSKLGSVNTLIAYIRDENGIGLSKIPVSCTSTIGALSPSNSVTSNTGSSTLILSSDVAGIATITCSTPSCNSLARSITVEFTK